MNVNRNLLAKRILFPWCLVAVSSMALVQPAMAAPLYNIVPLGLEDLEHTGSNGYKYSYAIYADQLNESGQVIGLSIRYNGGSADLGQSAWLYNGATTIPLGLTEPEHTRNDGYRYSFPSAPNNAGQVSGYSRRYNGGATQLGQSAWLYDGATTTQLGFTGFEYTRNDGYRSSSTSAPNEAGQVSGNSQRFNGGTSLGTNAWLYDGTTTIAIGFTGPEYTRTDGYKSSSASALDEAGHVYGTSQRFNGGSTNLGQSVWFYNGAMTVDIGLTGSEHTRNDGYKYSSPVFTAGQVYGYSYRYDGGSAQLGQSIWRYDGVTTIPIGLTGPEYTRNDGYKYSSLEDNNSPPVVRNFNEAGQRAGYSYRYNGGSAQVGVSTWLYDGATTIQLGLTGPEYTRSDGFYVSQPRDLNEAGQVVGRSVRFINGGSSIAYDTWLYNGATTIPIGLTGPEYTGSDGYRYSEVNRLNNAGQVIGSTANGGSAIGSLGSTSWLYDGARTIQIGLTGPEYTSGTGKRGSRAAQLNNAGHVIGSSERYNGGYTQLGQDAWLYNGTTTIPVGLTGPEYTRSDGAKSSWAYLLNEAGQAAGYSDAFKGMDTVARDAWFYDPVLHQSIRLRLSIRSDGLASSSPTYLGEDGLLLGTYFLFDALDNYLGDRVFYFTLADGLHDLGALVDGGLAANGWDNLASVIRANGLGQIIGHGKLTSQSGGQMAYLLTPIVVPEPSTFLLAAAAFAGLLLPRRAVGSRERSTLIIANQPVESLWVERH